MKTMHLLFIIVGILIFALSFLAGGIMFYMPFPGTTVMWFAGLIFVAVGLELHQREKKGR